MAVENVMRNRKEDHWDFCLWVINEAVIIESAIIFIDSLVGYLFASIFIVITRDAVFISLFFCWFTGPFCFLESFMYFLILFLFFVGVYMVFFYNWHYFVVFFSF